jgi:hypothetical protein
VKSLVKTEPTSKRVVMRESNNAANVPVGRHGIIKGEEGNNFTRSTPYETAKPVASSVQTVIFGY